MTSPDHTLSQTGSSLNRRTGRLTAVEPRMLSGQVDLLRSRLWALNDADKGLMEMYLEGVSFRQMASVAGVNEATVSRRIGKIIKRLMDATYIICLRNRQELGELSVAIAHDYLIGGMSYGDIARKHDVSLYRVKKTIAIIRNINKSKIK